MACKLYPIDQIVDGKPIEGAVGIPIDDTTAIQRLLLQNIDKLELSDFVGEKPIRTEKTGKREYKSVVTKAVSQSNLTPEVKEKLLTGELQYNVLSNEEANTIANELIDQLGGVEAAFDAVRLATDQEIMPVIKVMVAGGAQQAFAQQAIEAETEGERELFADKEGDAINWLDDYARGLGQGIQAISFLYKQSSWGLENAYKKKIDKANKQAEQRADKVAPELTTAINEITGDIKGNLNEAAADVFGSNQKEIDDLRRENEQLKQKLKPKPQGTKNNPLKIFKERAAQAKGEIKNAYDLLIKPKGQQLLPDEMGALVTVIQDMIEGGVTKAADIFDTLSEKIQPKFAEGFEEAYLKAKDNLPDLELDTNEAVAEAAANTNNEIAKKIVENNNKIAAAEYKKYEAEITKKEKAAKKEADALIKKYEAEKSAERKKQIQQAINDKEKEIKKYAAENQSVNIGLDLAARIKKDADSLNFPKTKKQQDALARMLKELERKAKDFYEAKKEVKGRSSIDLLNFAAKNLADSKRIWDGAKATVNDMIDADKNYSEAEKEQLKDFLQKYQDSVFDTLLSNSKANAAIKEALEKKGFTYIVQVKGVDEVRVDWKKIIGKAGNTAAAKIAISDWVMENTGLTESEAKPVIEQLFRRYDNIVRDKIEGEVKKLLNKKTIGKKQQPKIDRLVMLSEQGLLDNNAVKQVLSQQFGIINMTPAQETEFKQLIKEYANAPVGFLKGLAGENLEGFVDRVILGPRLDNTWDYIKGESTLAAINLPSVFTMRFYGMMTHIKNASSMIDVSAKVLYNALTTGDLKGIKVAFKEMEYGWASLVSVLQSGNIGTSAALTNEMANVGRKYPVRTMEQRSPKLFGVVPDFFIDIKGKPRNINIPNVLLKAEKYNPRLAEAVDSFNWAVMASSEQYKFLKHKLRQENPNMSRSQIQQMAYDKMYGFEKPLAEKQAREEFEKMGKIPTKAELNRRILEIQVQNRDEESRFVASKIADEVTLKTQEMTGIFNLVGTVLMKMKSSVNEIIEQKTGGDVTRRNKMLKSAASFFANSVLPFVNGVTNFLERAAEFDAFYGTTKGLVYLGKSMRQEDMVEKYIIRQRAYEYMTKATVGAMLYGLLAMLAAASAEDDPDSYITGQITNGDRPPNTLRIFGKSIPLELFGSMGLAMSMYADYFNAQKDEDKDLGVAESVGKAYVSKFKALSQVSFMQSASNLAKFISGDVQAGKKYGTSTITNAALPFAGASRQLRNLISPKAMDRKGFAEELYNSGGIYTNWLLDRPAVDYFGREYTRGQKYGLTGDISDRIKPSEAEVALINKGVNITKPLRDDNTDLSTTKYPILNKDGQLMPLDDYQWNEFQKIAGKEYKKLVENYYKDKKEYIKTADVAEIRKDINKARTLSIQAAQYALSVKYGKITEANKTNFIKALEKLKETDKPSPSGYKFPKLNDIDLEDK